ncbi:hypothetical protein DY926_09540 [Komagataeibacter melaceti]|uniref:Uncharacterized protein n=1 Tax=Komagataeibacter melaceti TaxID=2766577 RepID=A0A371YZZ6_9PROT|nr:hypothetical protein [Komagataeibacter melaceti]RFD19783.1 hypothetical protein DY926_09540 [Komagataeibacter melaceti]
MSGPYETPCARIYRRSASPFDVWVKKSLHDRFDTVCTESMPAEILTQFDSICRQAAPFTPPVPGSRPGRDN